MKSLTADILGEAALSSERLDLWGASPSDECTGNAWWGCERVGSGSNYLPPAYSARLRTVNSFTCKYCRVEVEAKLRVYKIEMSTLRYRLSQLLFFLSRFVL